MWLIIFGRYLIVLYNMIKFVKVFRMKIEKGY